VEGTFNEWQLDTLAAPNTANKQLEGDDVSAFDAITADDPRGQLHADRAQDADRVGTEEVVDKAGRKSELGYQIGKKGKELKRDIEAMLLNNIAANAGAAGVARVTGSLLAFVKSNVDFGATGANPVYTTAPTATRTDGTQRAFTETILKNVIQLAWVAGAEPSTR
jgi:hypothetical protein